MHVGIFPSGKLATLTPTQNMGNASLIALPPPLSAPLFSPNLIGKSVYFYFIFLILERIYLLRKVFQFVIVFKNAHFLISLSVF